MAYDYESYRTNPALAANPYALRGSPGAFNAPSSSLWGNMRARSQEGQNTTLPAMAGGGFGVLGAGAASAIPGASRMASAFPAALMAAANPATFAANALLGSGSSGGNLADFATFGASTARKAQDTARLRQRLAVADWQGSENERLSGELAKSGLDVRADLGGELRQAIGAGGEMGDMNAVRDAMTAFQQRYQQYMLGRQRASQVRDVDAAQSDPGLALGRTRDLNAERQRSFSDLAESYQTGARNNAFNQARRGTLGGSTDVEQRGDLSRARDTAAASIEGGLRQKAQQYQMGDAKQREALMGLIYADDPSTAAAYSRVLEGLGQQSQSLSDVYGVNRQLTGLDSATSQNYSTAIGGALSAGSRPLEYYLSNRGTGA